MQNGLKKPLKIGFIIQENENWIGGVNYYKNLFLAIKKVNSSKIIPMIEKQESFSAKILNELAENISVKRFYTYKYFIKKIINFLFHKNYNYASSIKKKYKVDLYSHSIVDCKKPCIAWIPDFQHIHLPNMFDELEINSREKSFAYIAKNATTVILSSNDAKKDFITKYPLYAGKAEVLHFVSYIDKSVYEDNNKLTSINNFSVPEKYFYVPNQFWKHKNHEAVLLAIKKLKLHGINVIVIFSGNTSDYRNRSHFEYLKNEIIRLGIEDNVIILGIIEYKQVQYLMRNCIAIINPSFFEGWSSTVEESKSLGKNMILSNLQVHLEQNPDNSLFFNPNSFDELAEHMQEQWLNRISGPNLELEKKAISNMEKRMIDFGKRYEEIVLKTYANFYSIEKK